MNLYGYKKEDILKQIRNEYDYGYNHIEAKRQLRRDDKLLYVRESQQDRVDIHSIYTAIQTLMAIFYLNEIAVEFSKRKNGDEERAENANIVAEFDYNEMRLDVIDYVGALYKFMCGIKIQINGDFDFTSVHPTIVNVDPLSYIFDPKGWPTIHDHRFFGIETEMTMQEMKKAKYENYKDIAVQGETVEINESTTDNARGEGYTEDYTENKKHAVYIHGLIIDDCKYISVTGNDRKTLLSFKKLLPVFLEEEKDESKIPFPVMLEYFSYLPGESMGISVFDQLRSKQSAYSVLFNLMLKMAYKNAMWGDRLINTDKIKDLAGLAVPSLEGKDIPVNLKQGESINDVIGYVQKDQPTAIPSELRQWLSEESILDTGIDRNSQGVLAQGNNTLGEREMAQKNANLRFLLGSKQAMWGEIFRWKYLWYRQYAANLKSIDKKEFALETGYSEDFHAFKKDDFIGSDMLHLKLQSKAELQQEMEKMKLDRLARYPQEIAEAQMEGKNYKLITIQRNRMLDTGETKQRVMQLYPYTVDELKAMDKFNILKMAIKAKEDENGSIAKEGLRIESVDEQHEVFIELFQTLPENPLKRKAIAMRYDMIKNRDEFMKQEAQAQQMMWQAPQGSAPTNSAASVATAQAGAAQVLQGQQWPSLQWG